MVRHGHGIAWHGPARPGRADTSIPQGGACRTPSPSAARSQAGNVESRASTASSELGTLCQETPPPPPWSMLPSPHTQHPPTPLPIKPQGCLLCLPGCAWPLSALTRAQASTGSSACILLSRRVTGATAQFRPHHPPQPHCRLWGVCRDPPMTMCPEQGREQLGICTPQSHGGAGTALPIAPHCLTLPRVPPSWGCLPLEGFNLRGFLCIHSFSIRAFRLRGILQLHAFSIGGFSLGGCLPPFQAMPWATHPCIPPRHLRVHPRHSYSSCQQLPKLLLEGLPWGSALPGQEQQLGGVKQPIPAQVLPLQGSVHQHGHLQGQGGEWGEGSAQGLWGVRGLIPMGPTASGSGHLPSRCASTVPSSCSSSSPSRRPLRLWSCSTKR